MTDLDTRILARLISKAAHTSGSYFWCNGERMGIETGIFLSEEEAERIDDLALLDPEDEDDE